MGTDLRGKELGKGLSQRKEGYYVARFTSREGKRISKNFTKLVEARLWLRDATYDDEHSDVHNTGKGGDVTVNTWFEYWITEVIGPRLKYATRVSYLGRYKNRIQPIIGYMCLKDVRPVDCQLVLNKCMEYEDASGSISKIKSIMKDMFNVAVENRMINSNPVTSSVKYKCVKPNEKRVFTVDEQRQFKELAKESVYGDAFIFILNTGLRIGELTALKWRNVDFENKTISIDSTAYFNEETKTVEENSPKSMAGYRTIPLTQEAEAILLKIEESQKNSPKIYVFYNSNGSRIIEKSANKALKRIVRDKMGITESFTPHSLRHTFATRCAEMGMKPKVLQVILGHEDISTTLNLYVHSTKEEIFSEMSKMDEMLKMDQYLAQKGI